MTAGYHCFSRMVLGFLLTISFLTATNNLPSGPRSMTMGANVGVALDRYHIFLLAIGAGLAVRIVMHFVDKRRIKDEVELKGGRIISISWTPFARGWFFEKNERHYSVIYTNRSGATVSATCKTSLFTGVYWEDSVESDELKPRFLSRHHCSKCGYAIHAEWRACPNCGEATGFA